MAFSTEGKKRLKLQKPEFTHSWPATWGWCFIAATAIIGFARYAIPLQDGDLWFHLAYARYFIENHTLIPDHTIFSWTPASNATLYCAWLSELVLFGFYKLGGLFVLFLIRYFALALLLLLFFRYAYTLDVFSNPVTLMISVLIVFMSHAGLFIKPELFSYIFFTVMVAIWWWIKSYYHSYPDANLDGIYYLFPLIMLVWANCHGGFLFGGIFLAAVLCGEYMNAWLSPERAIPKRARRHLLYSFLLCVIAVFVTPYGPDYPLYLIGSSFEKIVGDKGLDPYQRVLAYRSVLSETDSAFFSYLVLSLGIQIALATRSFLKAGVDWTVVTTNIVFFMIYAWLARATYFLAPVFGFSSIYLLSFAESMKIFREGKMKTAAFLLSLVFVLTLSGKELWKEKIAVRYARWMGFGISYASPVSEAEYLRKNVTEENIGCTYTTGAYFLWSLWPEKKVMIDARHFPYKEWYEEYQDFQTGRNLDGMISKYPCNVWVVDYYESNILKYFVKDPGWRVAFYGPSAVVFLRESPAHTSRKTEISPEIFEIRNFLFGSRIFFFAVSLKDYEIAHRVKEGMKKNFTWSNYSGQLDYFDDFLEAIEATERGEYHLAVSKLERWYRKDPSNVRQMLSRLYHSLSIENWNTGRETLALDYEQKAISINSNDPYALFNYGVISWYLEATGNRRPTQMNRFDAGNSWRFYLEKFLRLVDRRAASQQPVVKIAEDILKSRYNRRPPLIMPPES